MAPTTSGFQLSPQQHQLWLQQGEKDVFRSQAAILVEGSLDRGRLRHALERVVDRHEILRTTFVRQAGLKVPLQTVHTELPPSWEELDLVCPTPEEQAGAIDQRFEEAGRSTLDLASGPMVRASLLKLASDRHMLLLTVPSLCADSRSVTNLVADLSRFYQELVPPDEPIQYADYSAWQNELLQKVDEDSQAAKKYWSEQKLDELPPLRLPLQSERDQTASAPDSVSVAIDRQTVQRIQRHAGKDAGTFLFACWQGLMGRLAGRTDFVSAFESDGRTAEELGEAVGLFARALPVRISLEDDPAISVVVEESRKRLSEAIQWQDFVPAAEEACALPVTFSSSAQPAKQSGGGVDFTTVRQRSSIGRFELHLHCVTSDAGCVAELRCDSAKFNRPLLDRLAGYFLKMVEAAAEKPQSRLSEPDLLSESERHRLLVAFNQTAAEFPRTDCVHHLFEQHAQQEPQRPVLRYGEQAFTYAELNAAANQLAHALRSRGVKNNTAVGLCVERSAEMIVGLLGIMKAGGAYVPLVPDNPKARLAHQLSETQAAVVVTQERFLSALPEFKGDILCLDRDQSLLQAEPATNPDPISHPEDLVYVIYTSGSTGTPKGVAVRHSNLANYTYFICRRLGIAGASADSALNFATVSTISADLGNTCIFPALASGGCLHVIGYEVAMSGNLFAEYATRYPIDVLKITPSHLRALLNSSDGKSVLPRRFLVLGGEAATWELVDRVRSQGTCAVVNHYGPTEATVGCCTFAVNENDVSAWAPATVPIGRPIANAEGYIMDQHLRPVPVGVAGELCVGGAGLAQGYLNQPQQTAERFIPHPFSADKDARLYRTGDLARYLPDGSIEFLGRIDQQVKIRGFRVEPAEIENVLKRHPSIQQIVIVPQADRQGDKQLVAYVVPSRQPAPSAEALRGFLHQQVPDYMIPSAFVTLESIPLTLNGKVDLRALPSPGQAQPTRRALTPPRNDREEQLAAIWREVLGIPELGIEDNFFDLGGHSLLATQVIARIRGTFKIDLPLRCIFEARTVASLAEEMSHYQPAQTEDGDISGLLQELEGLSEEEAERLLAEEVQRTGGRTAS